MRLSIELTTVKARVTSSSSTQAGGPIAEKATASVTRPVVSRRLDGPKSGKTMYNTKWGNKGQIITAGGMLYCYEEKSGNFGLVKATPEKFEIISSFEITMGTGEHWAHPVILDGILYIRHGDTLMAYNIKAK